jgi:hypothetical protein
MTALHAQADDSDRPQRQSIGDALTSLKHALKILDESDVPPHIGARLQEIIEFVGGSARLIGPQKLESDTDNRQD